MKLKALFFLSLLALPGLTFASVFSVKEPINRGPFPLRTQNPLYLLFVSEPLESASTLGNGVIQFNLETNFSNIFERQISRTNTPLDLDMEIWRTALKARYGLGPRWDMGIEIPLMTTSGGFLDGFLQGYHSTFGFPNAGRENVAKGRYAARVSQNGQLLYSTTSTALSLSDISLWQKVQLVDEQKYLPALSTRATLKIPTGSPSHGTGSGEVDFGFSLLGEKNINRFHFVSQAGFKVLGGQNDLEPTLREMVFVFGQAIEFNLLNKLSFIAQVNGETSPFKYTDSPLLTGPTLDLGLGFKGDASLFKRQLIYSVGLSEDALSDGPSIDFTLFVDVGVKF